MPIMAEVADDARSSGPTRNRGARCPACSAWGMLPVGYLPRGQERRVDCDRPLRVVCCGGGPDSCWYVEQWACGVSSEAKCRPCSERVRKHYSRVIETGLSDGSGHAYFLTLTAPGLGPHKQWIQGKWRGSRPVCSCHDNGLSLAKWNGSESSCWNRLRTALARRVAGGIAYAGAVEAQERGALHRHIVIRSATVLHPREVQELAMAAGYGCVFDLQPINSAAGIGRYLSKYITKGADRDRVPWERIRVDHDTGEITEHFSPTYRLRSQSRDWGCTMKDVRATAGLQARARAKYLAALAQLLESDSGAGSSALGSQRADSPDHAPP